MAVRRLKKRTKSVTIRVTVEQKKELEQLGGGNHRHGIVRLLEIHELVKKDPAIILQKELEHFSNLVNTFASENHYGHYINSNLPALLHKFIKTGRVDPRILKAPNKVLDEYEEDEDGNASDGA